MTPTHLVYLVHADPSVRDRYVAAIDRAGITADVVALVGPPVPGLPGGGLSARYDQLGAACRAVGAGSVLRGLAARYRPPRALGDYEHVLLATYSAGYGLARQLSDVDRAMLSGLVLIDSGHGPEGLPAASIEWLVRWATAARSATKVLLVGHSDVDPVTYASTTEVAERAIALSGGPVAGMADWDIGPPWGDDPGLRRRRRAGLMVVEAYDRRPASEAKGEHGDALTVWGDELVAQACALTAGLGAVEREPAQEPLETAGNKPADPERERAPRHSHGYRCAVAELYRDAVALGMWRPAGSSYVPKRGDLVISARAGGDPTKGGSGHVERVESTYEREPLRPVTIGGNENNQWVVAEYRCDTDPSFRGCIEVDARLGERAADLALVEMKAGVRERPGAQHHPRIQEYHAGARRGGSPLAGMPGHEAEGKGVLGERAADEVAWCASAASWCAREAARQT